MPPRLSLLGVRTASSKGNRIRPTLLLAVGLSILVILYISVVSAEKLGLRHIETEAVMEIRTIGGLVKGKGCENVLPELSAVLSCLASHSDVVSGLSQQDHELLKVAVEPFNWPDRKNHQTAFLSIYDSSGTVKASNKRKGIRPLPLADPQQITSPTTQVALSSSSSGYHQLLVIIPITIDNQLQGFAVGQQQLANVMSSVARKHDIEFAIRNSRRDSEDREQPQRILSSDKELLNALADQVWNETNDSATEKRLVFRSRSLIPGVFPIYDALGTRTGELAILKDITHSVAVFDHVLGIFAILITTAGLFILMILFGFIRHINRNLSQTHSQLLDEIEERKKVEEFLRESKQRYSLLTQSIPGIVFQFKMTGDGSCSETFIEGNIPELCCEYGIDQKECGLFFELIHEDDVDDVVASLIQAASLERTWSAEYRIKCAPGSERWVRATANPGSTDEHNRTLWNGVMLDVTDKKKEEKNRLELEEELLRISERERRRIGYELHDSIGQQLTGIAFMVKATQARLESRDLTEAKDMEDVSRLINDTIDETRDLAKMIHPIDLKVSGFLPALEQLMAMSESLFGIECRLICDSAVRFSTFSDDTAMHLYRITEEAILNAIRHGKAKSVWVEINKRDKDMVLIIQNDGEDFPEAPVSQNGMGLKIMDYRAQLIHGSVTIGPRPAGGAHLSCKFRENN
ncbi:Nitrate/nitrite sensor protein NarX [Anaerohalosphaera lusitana]|uniref:histidine kinase n=1 Tax=Anaerohalosphaera lusitana TaxID=1936003 RepID=A0A1U9NNX3_9BACT|nr:histidine kinase [Anaerohalosphaera lusitana]AQT69434.1 Nitrate/nitrite sensor protein NarX [Anaerohalosphaera lusitana]